VFKFIDPKLDTITLDGKIYSTQSYFVCNILKHKNNTISSDLGAGKYSIKIIRDLFTHLSISVDKDLKDFYHILDDKNLASEIEIFDISEKISEKEEEKDSAVVICYDSLDHFDLLDLDAIRKEGKDYLFKFIDPKKKVIKLGDKTYSTQSYLQLEKKHFKFSTLGLITVDQVINNILRTWDLENLYIYGNKIDSLRLYDYAHKIEIVDIEKEILKKQLKEVANKDKSIERIINLNFFNKREMLERNCKVLQENKGMYQLVCQLTKIRYPIYTRPSSQITKNDHKIDFSKMVNTYFILCIPVEILKSIKNMNTFTLRDSIYESCFIIWDTHYKQEESQLKVNIMNDFSQPSMFVVKEIDTNCDVRDIYLN